MAEPAYAMTSEVSIFAEADAHFLEIKRWLMSVATVGLEGSELERELEPRGRELMRLLYQAHVTRRCERVPAGGSVVGEDGTERTRSRRRLRHLMTIFGVVEVFRELFEVRGHASLAPTDADLNLPKELYSLEVRRRVARETSRGSFDEAVGTLEAYTAARVPKRQLEQLAVRAAQDFDAFYEQRTLAESPEQTSEFLVLTADGKGISMRFDGLRPGTQLAASKSERKLKTRLSSGEKANRKRMAEVAAVYTIASRVRTPESIIQSMFHDVRDVTAQPRNRPEQKRVWASVKSPAHDVIHEAFLEGYTRDPDGHKRWVALVDGDRNQLRYIKDLAASYGFEITIVVDVIHVLEYLWRAAHELNKPGSKAAEEWVFDRLLRVLEGKASTVAAGIRRSATRRKLAKNARKNVDSCASYLLNNKAHLRYDEYLAAGFPIATGVIEGACRHLVKDRMDITGARWGLDGAEAILRLRSLRSSGDFDEYWAFHERQEFKRNHQVRYAEGKPPTLTNPNKYGHLRLVG